MTQERNDFWIDRSSIREYVALRPIDHGVVMEAQPMRVSCSFALSAPLRCLNFSQSPAQSTQETKDKQPAQKPEAVPLKQPLPFGLEDGTPK